MNIGILGGGQLARMLALAGTPLGQNFTVLEPAQDACARSVARVIEANYDDPQALLQLAANVDCVTYEFESVPAEAVAQLGASVPVYPSPEALAVARDRLQEKNLFQRLGVETAPYRAVESLADLQQAVAEIGLPAILKTRTLGYDGKGQVRLGAQTDLQQAWNAVGQVPAIVEGFVAFDREVSIIAVRSSRGEAAFYPLSENRHQDGILRLSRCLHQDSAQQKAQQHALDVLEELDYVGVLAIEFFQLGEHLLANEMAPRVHNSGHWTIEGAQTSQFENHIRAILGLPLGSTAPLEHAAMVNLIGCMPEAEAVLSIAGAHLHDYGKAPRAGRKLGHVTLRCPTAAELEQSVAAVEALVEKSA